MNLLNRQQQKKAQKQIIKEGKWFVFIGMTVLIGHWVVFFLYARWTSILNAFQEFDGLTETYHYLPWNRLFENFEKFFKEVFTNKETGRYIFNGYLFWAFSFLISQFSILIAFYVHKKYTLSGVMFFILLIPGCLAGPMMPTLFKFFVEKALPSIAKQLNWEGDYTLLFSRQETALGVSLFMSAFFAFPGAVLFYVSQFGKIPTEQVEAAQLDGITFVGEFIHIAFPAVYGVWSLGNLTILTAGLTYGGPGYTLYRDKAYKYGMVTFGYDLLIRVLGTDGVDPRYMYGYSAAVNLTMSILSIIGIQTMRRLMDKLDPNKEF